MEKGGVVKSERALQVTVINLGFTWRIIVGKSVKGFKLRSDRFKTIIFARCDSARP